MAQEPVCCPGHGAPGLIEQTASDPPCGPGLNILGLILHVAPELVHWVRPGMTGLGLCVRLDLA